MPATRPATPAANRKSHTPLLDVHDLFKHFPVRGGLLSRVRNQLKAVDGVSFSLGAGKTLGLVGESGCGKTTVGRTILRLIPATSGSVLFEGHDVLSVDRHTLRNLRRRMQIIFQDPYGSLNPRMTVQQIVAEPLYVHGMAKGQVLRDEVSALLKQVGLRAEAMNRYPHEFSGGQRQRIGVARALALKPAFIVCDEPTSALDVSIRAQIINLLQDLQQAMGLSYLMISHDLGVVRHISDEVAVMYLGKIVEQASTEALYGDPRHPYTQVLLSAIPVPDPKLRASRAPRVRALDRDDNVPSPINVPAGCAFHPRCPLYAAKGRPVECRTLMPELLPRKSDRSHAVRCHFTDDSAMAGG
ncbi:MAG: ATP-binding cassette domain-containing protein [Planctomycetaceae bacterium]|nr:ATP-binding cassette domain-containing protein [Planctomycetaceae bacterium]